MATLKISDLSVGDWVYVKWKDDDRWQGQIRETSCTGRLEARLLDDTPFKVRCTIELVEPIPITPEILKANGFLHNGKRWYTPELFTLERWSDNWTIIIDCACGDYVCEVYTIKYIHQLQHALRLAGVEKEIVMPKK